jgi:hypothetical protein
VTNNIVLKWVDIIDKNPTTKNNEKPKICLNDMRYTEKHTIDKNYVIQTDTVEQRIVAGTIQVDTKCEDHIRNTEANYYNRTGQAQDSTDQAQETNSKHRAETAHEARHAETPNIVVTAREENPEDELTKQGTAGKIQVEVIGTGTCSMNRGLAKEHGEETAVKLNQEELKVNKLAEEPAERLTELADARSPRNKVAVKAGTPPDSVDKKLMERQAAVATTRRRDAVMEAN